ncbi:chloride channel protein [Allobranchiibius huperziae]|uniref:H+/Cl- antiporter ClcA n=1 Tax=Allobranchiibius huperziae TaxID=1874116 RepID=A0A853DBL0_9MICO|nr:chloride channel protein [Allobranchiibius huperziae]NYJ74318.1 H+/Cl- antiporter ClcA [Allobranchiibius huperziae]
MMQPNVTHDGDAALTLRFWGAIVLTGVLTGLIGDLLMGLLRLVSRIAFGARGFGDFADKVAAAGPWHRLTPLLVAGVIGGVGWYLLRRFTPGRKSEVDDVLWTGEGRLSVRRSAGTSVLSEIVVGLGASLGREAAPKLMGAVSGNVVAGWLRLTPAQLRLLVACGAGAGLACVYNVPLGGALFTAEVLVGAVNLPIVLPALACAGVATVTAWVGLSDHATYVGIPQFSYDPRLLVWALLLGPVVGVLAAGYVRLIGIVSHYRVTGRWMLIAPLVAFAVLGVLALRYPLLYGNGSDIARLGLIGGGSLALFVALAVLKPFVTLLCLGSGASGGLFTPVLSTGAALGAALGILWSDVWPGSPVGAYALIGAAAMVGAGMQAPLAALALLLELTHGGFGLMVPMIVAAVIATAITRWIDGYSIYSARLSAPARV